MDLGATVCRPKSPLCDRCPLAESCLARRSGTPDAYPRKVAKTERPRRHGAAYVLINQGHVALVRRPPRGLLGGMLGLPTTDWRSMALEASDARAQAPSGQAWRNLGPIEHVFTHFALTLEVWRGEAATRGGTFEWLPLDEATRSLPSVFLKALRAGLSNLL